jgi:hypothetical protein
MAITNAQQYKQLVNPPMKGKKRPGYRGEAAAASDKDAGRSAGRDTSAAGTGNVGGNFDRGSFRAAVTRGELRNLATRQAEDKAEEAVEVFRNRNRGGAFNKTLNFIPGIGAARKIASVFGPINSRDFFLERVAPNYFDSLSRKSQENMFDKYMSARGRNEIDAYGNPIGSDEGDGQQFIFPQMMMAQAPSITKQEPEDPQGLEGLRLAFRAEGGSMNDQIRQAYGIGDIVKKATSAVKKVVKSPVGKAALVGGALYFGGGKEGLPSLFQKFSDLSTLQKVGLGIGAVSALAGLMTPKQEAEAQALANDEGIDIEAARRSILNAGTSQDFRARAFAAEGGSMDEPVAKKTMPLLDMGGQEMDLRAEGGFVPIGRMEKADDVPARLSKNEFVFTAEAVRNAGEGNVDKGAEVMYNMMKNLEAGGDVSEESQGLEGARRMFQTSQRLEEVL